MVNSIQLVDANLKDPHRFNSKERSDSIPWRLPGWSTTMVVVLIILGGFSVRALYLPHIAFHPDEYISLIAARAVAEQGVPLLPSGLVYNSELLFSYASGLLMWLTGQSEFMGRWVGLFFGILVIPLAFITGKRIFSSPLVGLTVMTFFAFAPEMVLWGARARRYSVIQLFVVLILWLVWVGVIEADRRKFRLIFYGVTLLAGSAGLLVLMIFPPLVLAVALLTWRRYMPKGRPRPDILLELGLFALIMLGLLWYATNDFIAQYPAQWRANQQIEAQNSTSLVETIASVIPFLVPKFNFFTLATWIQDIAQEQPIYILLVGLALPVALLSFLPLSQTAGRLRQASWFMLLLTLGVALEFLFGVSENWQNTRYLLGSFWPTLTILAGGAVAWLEWLIWQGQWSKKILTSTRLASLLMILVVTVPLTFTLPVALNRLNNNSLETADDYQSFQFVARSWQPQDKIIVTTTMPPISLWYLGRADYYARPASPYVFLNSKGELTDIWAGAHWIQEPTDLEGVFKDNQRVWLVIDERRLYQQLPLWFRLHIFARMELVFKANNIQVFRSLRQPHLVPFAPITPLALPMDRLELTGYSLDESALHGGSTAMLTLYWRVVKPLPLPEAKVFVHLRDSANHTVLQADHIPSEAIVPLPFNTWPVGEVVPDVSYLTVPVDLPPGEYKLLVGVYDPKTLQRLPVQNDSTGENAIVLLTIDKRITDD